MAWRTEVIFCAHAAGGRVGQAHQVEGQPRLGLEDGFEIPRFGILEDQAEQPHQRHLGMRELLAGDDGRLGEVVALEQLEAEFEARFHLGFVNPPFPRAASPASGAAP
jgi:hypothetical protein